MVGGGFGGVKAALELAKDRRFHITLISSHSDFRIYGTLYHVATGGARRVSSIPLTEIFAGTKVKVVIDKVTALDRKARAVITGSKTSFGYDALVLSLGVTTNFFHIEGLEEFAYGIKTPDDAEKLKQHLHKQMVGDGRTDLNYVVVGGGPTGVELAGVLPSYIRKIAKSHGLKPQKVHVDLIEAAPRLLPRMPKDLSKKVKKHLQKIGITVRLNKAVQAQSADALMVDGKPIRSHTVIWTAGVTNNPFFSAQEFQLTHTGKVRVDQYLQAEPGIYVIGDNADTPYTGMAQVAISDAKYVAKNLVRLADKKEPHPYHAKKPIYVMPAGPGWSAALWGNVRIYGRLGHFLRRMADYIAYHDYVPWQMALSRWTAEYDDEENCTTCDGKLQRVKYESGEV
ncbi:MAG TPA: FAD-dependent oxidoreductase [Verrucomicrobiae bacterium]|nr:FAD-dependent oxidoreductase [Verrucomicrobiae bacterium]